jgi:hypothetical protein
MSWGLPRGSGTYGAPMSGKHARMFGNGGRESRNGYGRGKSQARRGKSRGGKDIKGPGRGECLDRWG